MIEISVVIPSYNRKDLLKKCLLSLFDQNFDKNRYEIIVVDDGSKDETSLIVGKLIKKSPVKLTYLRQKNSGAASARNNGVKKAKGEILSFTDDDCIVDKNWLKTIYVTFQQNPNIVACAGEVKLHPTDFIQTDSESQFSDPFSPSCPASNNFAILTATFLKIGGFDSDLYVNEDNDIFIRLLKRGFTIYVNESMKINHTSRTDLIDLFRQNFHYGVEDAVVFKKNFPDKLVIRIGKLNICNTRSLFPICLKFDPFNIFFLSLFLLPFIPYLTVLLFMIITVYFVWLCLKSDSLSAKTLIQMYPINFGRIIGNIAGSLKYGVVFYGP